MKIDAVKKIFVSAITLAAVVLVGRAAAQTAGTQLIVTWQAQNYFPADFPGKALMTPGSRVVAAVAATSGGKFVNLASAQVTWFVNDVLVQSGTGLESISFTANPNSSGLVTIRVQVQTASGTFSDSESALVVTPFSVIDYPSLGKTLPSGGKVTLTAWPYFFNVGSLSDLKFTWQLNGQTITSGSNTLTVDVGNPQGGNGPLPVTLTTQNTQNPLEFGRTVNTFNIQ